MNARTKHDRYPWLLEACEGLPLAPTAVAHPYNQAFLGGAPNAAKRGLIAPPLGAEVKIRAAVGRGGEWLVEIDSGVNASEGVRISTAVRRLSGDVPTEEPMIARHTSRLVVAAVSRPSEVPA